MAQLGWIHYTSEEARQTALGCVRKGACYQEALLNDRAAWSGSTLKGAARKYGYHYMISRRHLLRRMECAGLTVTYGPVQGQRHYALVVEMAH